MVYPLRPRQNAIITNIIEPNLPNDRYGSKELPYQEFLDKYRTIEQIEFKNWLLFAKARQGTP